MKRPTDGPRARLREQLVDTLADAVALTREANTACQSSDRSYGAIAEVLIRLRHEFRTSRGAPDLRGRSCEYRRLVRQAYAEAGATADSQVCKRLTVGVAYWVRKLLLQRYGEAKLREMGVVPRAPRPPALAAPNRAAFVDPSAEAGRRLAVIAETLNALAADPSFVPSEQTMRSAVRAIALLQQKLARYRSIGVAS